MLIADEAQSGAGRTGIAAGLRMEQDKAAGRILPPW